MSALLLALNLMLPWRPAGVAPWLRVQLPAPVIQFKIPLRLGPVCADGGGKFDRPELDRSNYWFIHLVWYRWKPTRDKPCMARAFLMRSS
jgi:hypothetical protein